MAWLRIYPLCQVAETSAASYQAPDVWNPLRSFVEQAAFAAADALASHVICDRTVADFVDDERWAPVLQIDRELEPLVREYKRPREEYQRQTEPGGGLGEFVEELQRRGLRLPHDALMLRGLEPDLQRLYQVWKARKPEIEMSPFFQANLIHRMRTIEARLQRLHQEQEAQEAGDRVTLRSLAVLQRRPNITGQSAAAVQAAAGSLVWLYAEGLLSEEVSSRVCECLRAVFDAAHLRERIVRLLPGFSARRTRIRPPRIGDWMLRLEPFFPPPSATLDALAPAAESVPPVPQAEQLDQEYGRLAEISRVFAERLPQGMRFLESYPLQAHAARRTPERTGRLPAQGRLWSFGIGTTANGRKDGEVTDRFLRINDRNQPNSIGLEYHLLSHPLLAVPVLFHGAAVHY